MKPAFLCGAALAAYPEEGARNSDGKGPFTWDFFTKIPG
jgi:beta-glucosidase/6-phospho-beta-glucosidase/beta-galactosidase